MKLQLFLVGQSREFLRILLALVMATAPSISAMAQGLGAIQAVRQRVSGLEGGPGAPPGESRPGGPEQSMVPGANGAKLDTAYVSPNASVLLVIRPAQLIKSPMGQMFPVEVAAAAGLKYVGFDPVDVDEVVAFLDMTNPVAPAYGATIKFNKPFRAAALPPQVHPFVQLSEFNGKKYLQSSNPMWPSFYGPNNKTMIVAPDAMLKQIVPASSQPKTGKLIDLVHDVPAGSDAYLALDMVALRPLMQMGLAQAQAKAPPEAKQYMEALNLVSAAELTLNLVTPGTTSLVLHGNDEGAAQQIETVMQEAAKKYQESAQAGQPPSDDPVQQALGRYKERMAKPFQPLRTGTNVTCIQFDGQDPTQRQLLTVAVFSGLVVLALPAIQVARNAARRAQAASGPGPEGPPSGPGAAPAGTPAQ